MATNPGLRLRRGASADGASPARTRAEFLEGSPSVPHAQRSARAFETQTAAALSRSRMSLNIHNMFINLQGAISRSRPAGPLLGSRQQSRNFHVFPLAFPDGNGLAAQLHKQSPVGTTRQLLCSRAAIPCRRQFLEKVRKNGIFVVFLRKEN